MLRCGRWRGVAWSMAWCESSTRASARRRSRPRSSSLPDFWASGSRAARAILLLAQAQHPLLDGLRLLAGHALGVGGVAGLLAEMPEAAHADLLGLRQQVRLVDRALAHRVLGAGHVDQVLEADLGRFHSCH